MAISSDFLNELRYSAIQAAGTMDAFNSVMFSDDLPSEIATTQHTFIFSGPPTMKQGLADGGVDLVPVGLIQDLQLSGQRQIAPIPEIGNRFYRHIPGRVNYSASMSRVLCKSANVIGMMYAWVLNKNIAGGLQQNPNSSPTQDLVIQPGNKNSGLQSYSLQVPSLDSDLIDIPFGIYAVKLTEEGDVISAAYWERCLIAGYSEATSAGQVMIMEQIQLVMARVMPARNILGVGTGQSFQIKETSAASTTTSPGGVSSNQSTVGGIAQAVKPVLTSAGAAAAKAVVDSLPPALGSAIMVAGGDISSVLS